MRPIWSGSLNFGLINIPVKVYPASEERALEFDLLHKKDLSPIRYARICKEDGHEIAYSDIVKGFEYKKGSYVVVDEKDFAQAYLEKRETIEIVHFTLMEEIDPIYFSKPYYLEPDKKSSKPYFLLQEALKKAKKVAIAKFVFRNKEHIGMVACHDNVLVLIQLRYASEIRDLQLQLRQEKISEKELEFALLFIDQLTTNFNPSQYSDTYTEELMNVIERKLQGKKRKKEKPKKKVQTASDLASLLKQSLQKSVKDESKKSLTFPPSTKKRTKRKSR